MNGCLFQGQQVVLPNHLERIDRETDVFLTNKRGAGKGIQRYRDIVMRWKGEGELAVLAVENQERIFDPNVFQIDLQYVLNMIKYRKNKKKILEYVESHRSYFQKMNEDSYEALSVFLNSARWLKATKISQKEGERDKKWEIVIKRNTGVVLRRYVG